MLFIIANTITSTPSLVILLVSSHHTDVVLKPELIYIYANTSWSRLIDHFYELFIRAKIPLIATLSDPVNLLK